MLTPWGRSDFTYAGPQGVYSVSTPGHGGVLVGRVAQRDLSPQARKIGKPFGNFLAFEEDCDWAAVGYEHPEWLLGAYDPSMTSAYLRELAEQTLRAWHPEYFTGGK